MLSFKAKELSAFSGQPQIFFGLYVLSENLELTKCLLRVWEFVNGFTKQRFKWPGSFAERHLAYLTEKGV